jgi:copper transport protein
MAGAGLWIAAVLRWPLFAGLAVALGGIAGRGLASSQAGEGPVPLPSPWALRASLIGLAASVGLIIDWLTVRPRMASQGVIIAVELVSFAIAAILLRLRRPALAAWPLCAVIAAEGVRAHPEHIVPIGGALLTWAHLAPAALWAGMLCYTVRAAIAWRSDPAAVRRLVGLYSRAAAWLFAAVVITGITSALVLVPVHSLFSTSYGWVVIIKAVLVGVAAVLATRGRRWLRRGGASGEGPALATKLEAVTLIAVLAVTAILTGISPPRPPLTSAGHHLQAVRR